MFQKINSLIYRKSKGRLILEAVLLYIAIPLMIVGDIIVLPLLQVLFIIGFIVFLFLRFDKTFDKNIFVKWRITRHMVLGLLLFIINAVFMILIIYLVDPSKLFYLLKTQPFLLVMIAVFYPLFSVVPQGLAYRCLFFHRYADLFPGVYFKIVSSALFFSFGHILYKSYLVLILTFIAGLIFGYSYYKTKSLLWSSIEHALYGVWLFASGLGIFFVSSLID